MNVTVYNPNIYKLVLSHMDLRANVRPDVNLLRQSGFSLPRNVESKPVYVGYATGGPFVFEPQVETNITTQIMIELEGKDFVNNPYLRPEIERVCGKPTSSNTPSEEKPPIFQFDYVITLQNDFLEAFGFRPTITENKGVRCPLDGKQIEQLRSILPS
jgi:hypothetical protein